jgi:excisionase family DNA binding protein
MSDRFSPSNWMSVKEAAAHLGVHAATLRRWSDEGRIPAHLTPGGHRRFLRDDLDRFASASRVAARGRSPEVEWVQQALVHTRDEIVGHDETGWMRRLDEDARARSRRLGHELMGLLLQHLTAESTDEGVLEEVRRLGRLYGAEAVGAGLTLTQALRAVMFFRDTLLESTAYSRAGAASKPEGRVHLIRRLNAFLNTVQLAIAEAYDRA